MANGKPSDDSEEFVLRSGPRSGLKREFAFALKVHSEVSGSLGRTRSRKIQSPPSFKGVSANQSNKRIKTSSKDEAAVQESKKSISEEIPIEKQDFAIENPVVVFVVESDSEKTLLNGDAETTVIDDAEKTVNGDAEKMVEGDGEKMANGVAEKMVDGDGEKMANEKTSVIDDAETTVTEDAEKTVNGDAEKMVEGHGEKMANGVAAKMVDGDGEKMANEKTLVNGDAETTVIDDVETTVNDDAEKTVNGDAEKMVEGDGEKMANGVAAKMVDGDGEKMVEGDGEKMANGVAEKMVDGDGEKMVDGDAWKASPPPPTRRFTRSLSERMVDGDAEKMVDGVVLKTQIPHPPPSPSLKRFIQSLTEKTVDGDSEKMMDGDTEKTVDGNLVKTLTYSARRFTRSLAEKMLNGNAEKTVDGDEDKMVDGNGLKTPFPPLSAARRFTRSIVKGNQEATEKAVDDGSSVSQADDVKPCNNKDAAKSYTKTADEVSLLRASPKKKLELKMSKKIELNRLPSNIKDLLATGFLEGLPVKYIFRGRGNKTVLQGTIKGDGILCSCSSCNRSKVVLPFEFERHAGSLNKHPTQYIHFENGKTIREILNACKRAPLDMLESTIQSAISFSSVKKDATCQNIKESIQSSRVVESELVSNTCLESDQSQESPARWIDESPARGIDESPASPAISTRLSKTRLKPKASDSTSKQLSSQKKNVHGRLTKKDLRLHKLVFMNDVLPDGTEVAYYARGQRLLEGYKKGSLIFCQCCKSEVSPSQFEAHAGWASRRKPYLHIYTSNGVSLHELSVSLSKGQKFSASDNDDLCTICADGGNLLLCDGCPRAFHKDCIGLSNVPHGDWYCKYCQNIFEKEKAVAYNANALAAGRVLGVDPIEQITKRCIRIVKTFKVDDTVCVLCRSHDFSKSGFGPRTVLLCDQCEKEYHVGCLKDHNMGDLKELPEGDWFCCGECNKIHTALEKLVLRGSEALPDSLSDSIKQKHGEKSSGNGSDLDIRWRLLSGKITASDSRLLLSKAVAIFHDCFDPIVDSATNRDLIPSMVYGRNIRDQEFGGVYCAVLIVNTSVVSAGILRIFGQEVAELPLVATSIDNQGKGYFQSLFSCIERLLGLLNVKNLLLPAADEAESIWTKKFGFKKINREELCKYTKDRRMMTFQGTSMLHKLVPKCRIGGKPTESSR